MLFRLTDSECVKEEGRITGVMAAFLVCVLAGFRKGSWSRNTLIIPWISAFCCGDGVLTLP